MPNIKEIVSRISSVNSTQQITKAMKMVAAAKLNKAQQRLMHIRPYAKKLSDILLQTLNSTETNLYEQYTNQRQVQKLLLIVISSDKGLCGSFNANIIKKTEGYLKQFLDTSTSQIDLLIIGKKALTFFQKKNYNLITSYNDLATKLNFITTSKAADLITDAFLNHTYDRVELIYNKFISTTNQVVEVENLLPISFHTSSIDTTNIYDTYTYEPSKQAMLEKMIPLYLQTALYKALVESNASEQGSRMTTMSKATDNAETLLRVLRIYYNKTRQAAITNEISEITAGAESLT